MANRNPDLYAGPWVSEDPISAVELLAPATREFIRSAARCSFPVLLHGETGSGKTHLARLIHRFSDRAREAFVSVNCSAISEDLFENEMFGHSKGAFTGADADKPGLFEVAERGTLFLDEIGELSVNAQPKLLRALDEGIVRRVGSTRSIAVDARIISATNQDLESMIEERRFRRDLYYRCSVLEHRLPPLRERREALPALVQHLLAKRAPSDSEPYRITAAALEVLLSYDWPGNIRELDHCLCQAIACAKNAAIRPDHLPRRIRSRQWEARARRRSGSDQYSVATRRARYACPEEPQQEREAIREALLLENGNKTHAARRLGMARSSLWVKLKQYGMDGETGNPTPSQ